MNKILRFSIFLVTALILIIADSYGQGCVAVRNMASTALGFDSVRTNSWSVSANYRYFRSFRHFRGTDEETERVEQGTEVINNDNSLLIGINYTANNRFSFGMTIPYIYIDRSSLYEHYGNTPGNPRFHTQAQGIGDMRLVGYYNALQKHRLSLILGLGVKLPTGNFRVKDNFHKLDSEGQDSLVYKVVDQSIQLGDGGFGVIVEFDANYGFSKGFSAYATGMYMSNPMNTNGVERSPSLTGGIPLSNEFSVVDQFMARLGARYSVKRFNFALGGRIEGIPSEDLIGDSDGFRRPGYIISAEPSIGYFVGKHSFGVSVPIALERNRTQNTIDKTRSEQTGTLVQGDAAFADWLLSVSYTYRLGK
ncbi:MAG TPA: hypothetical protein VIU13_04075 [Chryseolinea sp.]